MFPIDPEALDSCRVLLILVAEKPPWTAAFVTGIAHWREGRFFLMCGQPPAAFEVPGTRDALVGWDPAILPRLLVSPHATTVLTLAEGVEACISVFGTVVPPGALTLAKPLFGVAKNNATGECLLFQREAEMRLPEENVSPEPWAAEPWMPDEDGWNPDEETRIVDPNYDPRDETEIRPHVTFDLKEGSDVHALFNALIARAPNYHDIATFDATEGVVHGFIRFAWAASRSDVDSAADWLRSQSFVVRAVAGYGGPIPPNEE